MTIQFELVVKEGQKEIVRIDGRKRDAETISIADTHDIPKIEQWLERIFGHRFHINMEEIE